MDALKEYRRKVDSGEIIRAEALNPIDKAKTQPKSLRLAINAKCYDCSGGQRKEVTLCSSTDCPLFNVRPWQAKKPL